MTSVYRTRKHLIHISRKYKIDLYNYIIKRIIKKAYCDVKEEGNGICDNNDKEDEIGEDSMCDDLPIFSPELKRGIGYYAK
jgi:hypothetical protein